ncbi:MAG: iron ABC transporter permease [Methanomethylovorans sp.]|uniref:FecCD family ABC transporter permease n=1 Tax=Methanomethylovorans sp. TaxID=2758717 RepID=UPI000A7D0281|nr:iron ABC transporter permease [Methanomethylovorans sp.]
MKNENANCFIKKQYKQTIKRKVFLISALILLLIGIIGFASTIGVIDFTIKEVYYVILNHFFPNSFEVNATAEKVVWGIRLPRICLGILAGIGLGIAGAVMQGILRNPLASPYTLGVSSGAGFGAAVAITLGAGFVGGEYLIIGNAFLGALMSSAFILILSSKKGTTPESMLLAGIALMYLFSASVALLQYFASDEAAKEVTFWLIGSLSYANWEKVISTAIVVTITTPFIMWKARDLNIIIAGDDTAKSLGLEVMRIRVVLMVLASLVTASIVCFTGTIGFIGLVAPHMTRMFIGGDNRFVFPVSALLGGVLLSVADMIAITVMKPIIIPIGIVTAFMGVPLFLYLIIRRKRDYW